MLQYRHNVIVSSRLRYPQNRIRFLGNILFRNLLTKRPDYLPRKDLSLESPKSESPVRFSR
jgi:hypothetical protein